MDRYRWLLLLLMLPLAASAQRTPPDYLKVCFSDGDCLAMMMIGDSYIGWTGPKMSTEWKFSIDTWTMEKIALSGRATMYHGMGIPFRSDRWVIKGTPDVIRDGIARAKAKDVSGRDQRAGRVTVTWAPEQPKIYGRVVR